MKKFALTVAATAALVCGCSGQRPTVDPAPTPTPTTDAPVDHAQPLVTCAEWNAQIVTPGVAPAQLSWVVTNELPPNANRAVRVRYLAGVDNYCRLLPADPLMVAADSVVLCLWPGGVRSLRGPDCAAVRGQLE